MPLVERSALLPFSATQLFELVQNVAEYPAFIPGCIGARVDEQRGPVTLAELSFRLASINDRFATENTASLMEPDQPRLQMRLMRGPFKKLEGEWRFTPLGASGCKVQLSLDLDFGPRALQALLAPQLERAVSAVIAAFRQRAEALYAQP